MTAIVRVDPILDELERMLGKSGFMETGPGERRLRYAHGRP